MKTILFIIGLMLSMAAQGQDTINRYLFVYTNYYDWDSQEYVYDSINIDSVTEGELRWVVQTFSTDVYLDLALYKAYLDYCYADSTYVEYHPQRHLEGLNITTAEYITAWKWIHKQPTFEGYVKWLEKLLK